MALTLLAALLLAQPGTAPEPPQAGADITVSNTRLTDEQISEQSRSYVKAVLPVPTLGQYARWLAPVCIRVAGLGDSDNDKARQRISDIATEAGVRLARKGCTPNLVVMFSDDGLRDVSTIVRRKPLLVRDLDRTQYQRLLSEAGRSARWWHMTQAGDGNGIGTARSSAALSGASLQNSENVGGTGTNGYDAMSTSSYSGSLIDTHLSIGIAQAFAVFDVPRVGQRSVEQLADFAAMVTLAQVPMDPPEAGTPSILNLFAPSADRGAGLAELSQWDRAYLKALYGAMLPNRGASQQRSQLVTALAAAIRRPGE